MNIEKIGKLITEIWKLFSSRDSREMARIAAYVLAPGLILVIAFSGSYSGGLAIDPEKPIAISELQTETNDRGETRARQGVAVIIDPGSSDFRIPLNTHPTTMWSSMNEDAARANRSRLVLDDRGLSGQSPFLGIGEPVTIVVDGQLGNAIQIPGGEEQIADWRLSTRRSGAVVIGALSACIFGFGISLATALPLVRSNQHATGQ